jgi:hypothetical protein
MSNSNQGYTAYTLVTFGLFVLITSLFHQHWPTPKDFLLLAVGWFGTSVLVVLYRYWRKRGKPAA